MPPFNGYLSSSRKRETLASLEDSEDRLSIAATVGSNCRPPLPSNPTRSLFV